MTVPVALGKLKVYEADTVEGAFNPAYSAPEASPNLTSPSESTTTFVPSQIKLADPPKASLLLN